jgi:hypothetical protein
MAYDANQQSNSGCRIRKTFHLFCAIANTDRLIVEEPEIATVAVRAIVAPQMPLRQAKDFSW